MKVQNSFGSIAAEFIILKESSLIIREDIPTDLIGFSFNGLSHFNYFGSLEEVS
jgi:hypothetical protein